jgi:hypothetical protein
MERMREAETSTESREALGPSVVSLEETSERENVSDDW